MNIELEQLTHDNLKDALRIKRDDIPTDWVDDAETLMETTDYGAENNLIGHTYLARQNGDCIGIIMIGEAIPWDTDPDELKGLEFYRLMGFTVDKDHRGQGLGGEIMEKAIGQIFDEFGKRPISLGVHKDNLRAGPFYERHGFKRTGVFEGNDEYYIRMN